MTSSIIIGIATYSRPEMLSATLAALSALDIPAGYYVSVLVVDNDTDGQEGRKIVDKIKSSGFPLAIQSRVTKYRGFTYARNEILSVAFGELSSDYVAIVDDDQLVTSGWLKSALATAQKYSAHIVGTAVVAQFTNPPGSWVSGCDAYDRDTTTEGAVARLSGDGGVLISRTATDLIPLPWYEHRFALSGGADADIFVRLSMKGAVFARSSQAVVYEVYGPSRTTIRWALQRAFRIGSTEMIISKTHHGLGVQALIQIGKIPAAILVAGLMLAINPHRSGTQVTYLRKIYRSAGKVYGLFGQAYSEYNTIHKA